MHDVVRMSPTKLKELFSLTAEQMAMPPAIVEKDFWVVWTLDYLFGRSPWKKLRAASTVCRDTGYGPCPGD